MAGRKGKDGYVCQPAAMVNRMRLRREEGIFFNARDNAATMTRGDE